ncbi:MAG: hypothetical protein ACO3YN_12965 [Rubrivivax sp.]
MPPLMPAMVPALMLPRICTVCLAALCMGLAITLALSMRMLHLLAMLHVLAVGHLFARLRCPAMPGRMCWQHEGHRAKHGRYGQGDGRPVERASGTLLGQIGRLHGVFPFNRRSGLSMEGLCRAGMSAGCCQGKDL